MKDTAIIIPTYNAFEGIIETIKRIKQNASSAYIYIVDDTSPDKTADLVNKNFKKDKNVILISRKVKDGRGSAVIAGFKMALKNKKFKYFIEMDADLCHDPKYISAIIKKCQNADVVIASRYLPKSRFVGWSMRRRILSRLINWVAKLLLQVPISDYSGGFRGYNRRAVEYIAKQHLISKGFIVLSEIAYICHRKGYRFAEIPFDFNHISISKSNLNLKEMKEAIFTLLALKFRH